MGKQKHSFLGVKSMKTIAGILAFLFSLAGILVLPSQETHADVIQLHVPILEDSPKQHLYFHELIKTAIEQAGHTPELIGKKLPQLRIKGYLDAGMITIYWMVESAERNQRYLPLEVGITNGLIGKRVLFIKKGDQPLYDKVETLEDFRRLNLIGGMGQKWFDVKVWKANDLKYLEATGNWQKIFKLIPSGRDFNYFSRGLNEILEESRQYPELAIEKRLALIYDRDFRFYLSKEGPNAGAKHKEILESALKKAQASGLIDELVKKYWGDNFKALDYDNRIKLHLKTPK